MKLKLCKNMWPGSVEIHFEGVSDHEENKIHFFGTFHFFEAARRQC
jgi:hypothetical protein